jgi:hypothetical protein
MKLSSICLLLLLMDTADFYESSGIPMEKRFSTFLPVYAECAGN